MSLVLSRAWVSLLLLAIVTSSSAYAAKERRPRADARGAAAASVWFPSWGTPNLEYGLSPVVGLLYRHDERKVKSQPGPGLPETTNTVVRDLVVTEAGLRAFVEGVPVVPGNPGAHLGVTGGYVWGWANWNNQDAGVEDESQSYTRRWIAPSAVLTWGWYRHTLTVGLGVREYDPEFPAALGYFRTSSSRNVSNDFAVLILPVLSAHYTMTWLEVFNGIMDDLLIDQLDHWLHARAFTSILNSSIDLGPGFTTVDEYNLATGKIAETGRTDYFLAIARASLWRLGLSARAKYITGVSNKALGSAAGLSLPQQSLYESPEVVMGAGSYYINVFAGISNLFAGFGAGWIYNLQVLKTEVNGVESEQVYQDQGPAITYTARF